MSERSETLDALPNRPEPLLGTGPRRGGRR